MNPAQHSPTFHRYRNRRQTGDVSSKDRESGETGTIGDFAGVSVFGPRDLAPLAGLGRLGLPRGSS